MKTLIKSILVVVMLGTYTGYANETLDILPTSKFVNKGDSISVTDDTGEVIYNGRINHSGNLIRLYDFSELNNGIYTVEISKDFEIEIIDLEVNSKIVTLISDSQKKIFKPVFRNKKNKLIISKIAFGSDEMSVELYYEDEMILKEHIEAQSDILNRVYKLDATRHGNYTAIIRTNNRVYFESFRI